jgi:prevent-host-death family protein
LQHAKPHRIWTVAEAKARLSEILRLAESEGPQHIGARKTFVVVPAETWYAKAEPPQHLGRWLLENVPRGLNWEIPSDRGSDRPIPYADGDKA